MKVRTLRLGICSAAIILLLLPHWSVATPDSVQYSPVSRAVIEAWLGKYAGDNTQRERTLKQMFAESRCDEAFPNR
jgi:hypothetical protein